MSIWTSTTRHMILAILLIGIIAFLYAIRAILGPLIIAGIIAYLLNPAVTRLKTKLRISHHLSTSIIYLLFILSLVVISISIVPVLIKQGRSLAHEIQALKPEIKTALQQPLHVLGYQLPLESFYEELQETWTEIFKPDRVFRIIKGATTNLVWILIILVTTYYLLLDWEQLRDWIFNLAPPGNQEDIRQIYGEIKSVWHAYLRGQLLLMTLIGLFSGVIALSIGLPRAAFIGLLAGLLDFIPSVGPIFAAGVAAFIAWFQGSYFLAISNQWFTILVIFLFSLIQLIENVWLQPTIIGHRLRLHKGIVFVVILGTLSLGSALLALIIVPTIGSLRLIGRYLHRKLYLQNPEQLTFRDVT
jgi:predicted PurR-regulated permease PerM